MRAVQLLWNWTDVIHPFHELGVHAGIALDLRAFNCCAAAVEIGKCDSPIP